MERAENSRRIPIKRILVVDDEPEVANAIRMVLRDGDHTVESAADGGSGLTRFEAGTYDLVIIDFKMPGIDGLELAAAIKARSPRQPILMITAYVEAVKEDAKGLSQIDFLIEKPFSLQRLQDVLTKVFSTS